MANPTRSKVTQGESGPLVDTPGSTAQMDGHPRSHLLPPGGTRTEPRLQVDSPPPPTKTPANKGKYKRKSLPAVELWNTHFEEDRAA